MAVVTTFHPEPGLRGRMELLSREVDRILMVDNGSREPGRTEVQSLAELPNVDEVWNGENRGLANALNQGLEWASARGAMWALLLDQDSQPEPGIVAAATRVLETAGPGMVAVVGSGIVGTDDRGFVPSGGWLEERAVITSGAFISIEAWRAIGGFRSDFFVDYVDIEFCLRARAHGYRVLRSLTPTLRHAIGRPVRHRLPWRTVTATHHDRARRYSITRNRMLVWRRYWRREPGFVIADAWAFTKELVKVVLFEDDRVRKARAIGAGTRDAFLRRTVG